MLVALFIHPPGYAPYEAAMLLLFYAFVGIVTNLVGGWLGAHIGLNMLMPIGMTLSPVWNGRLHGRATW
jgi:hypothetical protein